MIPGIDCASGTSGYASALKHAGYEFAGRYLTGSYAMTKAEASSLHQAGLAVVCIHEGVASGTLGGSGAGKADAEASAQAVQALGLSGAPVFFAVDFDVQISQLAAVEDYFHGAASVLGKDRVGIYGGLRAMAVHKAGICKYAWQTLAWSGGVWYAGAHLRQVSIDQHIPAVPFGVDHDQALDTDYGQWPHPKILVGYTISYLTKTGQRVTHNTRTPTRWLIAHPGAKKRGKVIITRRFST